MPDIFGRLRERYLGKSTFVVGGGHSAAGSLIAPAELAEIGHSNSLGHSWQQSLPHTGGGEADASCARGWASSSARLLKMGSLCTRTSTFAKYVMTMDR
jgi:hypothetical protein